LEKTQWQREDKTDKTLVREKEDKKSAQKSGQKGGLSHRVRAEKLKKV